MRDELRLLNERIMNDEVVLNETCFRNLGGSGEIMHDSEEGRKYLKMITGGLN